MRGLDHNPASSAAVMKEDTTDVVAMYQYFASVAFPFVPQIPELGVQVDWWEVISSLLIIKRNKK